MAEIVGVVASGAGVASLGIELLQIAYGLKDFSSSIKDAPAEIACLIDELLLLTNILKGIWDRRPPETSGTVPEATWEACHQHCESAVGILASVATELEASLKKHKILGSLRVVLSQQKVSKYKERLERAKSILLLAQQASFFTFMQIQQASILSKVEATQNLLQPTVRQIESRAVVSSIAVQVPKPVETETDTVQMTCSKPRYPRLKPSWAFRLSPWWLNRVFEMQRDHSWQGFSFSLRSYKIRSWDTLAIAGESSVTEVVQMLQDKKLFLWDQDPSGRTVLHFAALAENFKLCQFLVRSGLDVNSRARYAETPFDMLWVNDFYELTRTKYMEKPDLFEMVKLLAIENGADEILRESHLDSREVFSRNSPSVTAFIGKYLAMDMSYEQAAQYRFTSAMSSLEFDDGFFWARLGTETIPELNVARMLNENADGWKLFHRIAGHFGRVYSTTKNQPEILEKMLGWQKVVEFLVFFQPILTVPLDRRYEHKTCRSPLSRLLEGALFDRRVVPGHNFHQKDLLQVLYAWVQWLMDIGVNTAQYGNLEKQWVKLYPAHFTRNLEFIGKHSYRVICLETGPSASDWNIWLNNPLDEHSEDFWFLTENPEYFIPGAWQLSPANYGFFHMDCWKVYLSSLRRCKRLFRYMQLPQKPAYVIGVSIAIIIVVGISAA
ncbi:hypothetical protein PV08_05811 [Exophiala spinifera]|uniref:Uncharacterized protein n=1 Tax=Exophiala spinifera TaxID=91928 RepID=A0A0D1YL33_9EURO|nr:uncharacterized protein PV08_05811 [Exophiala spinifera]KIW15761.1 hypothetical protein PV08_05811 [Exophiala spinifera]